LRIFERPDSGYNAMEIPPVNLKSHIGDRQVETLEYADTSVKSADAGLAKPGLESLICGLMICVPFIAGLFAIVFGVFALRFSRSGIDRGFGIAGIVLGGINLLVWGLAAGNVGIYR
jgi:hypothetical protein